MNQFYLEVIAAEKGNIFESSSLAFFEAH